MLKFVDLVWERSKDRARISARHNTEDASWGDPYITHARRARQLARLRKPLAHLDAMLEKNPTPNLEESDFDMARRQLFEEASALVVCDARLGFELVRRDPRQDRKLYRNMQEIQKSIREMLETYKREIRDMGESPPPRDPTPTSVAIPPFPPALCSVLRRVGLACDLSGYQKAIHRYGGASMSYEAFRQHLEEVAAAQQSMEV